MESNSDKAMRAKLQGVEMPFDPAAWEQMEAMLNKDEKKRGFFWWWFGAGMASLLLLTGGGAYLAMHHSTQSSQLAINTERAEMKGENAAGGGESAGSTQENIVGNTEEAASNANTNYSESVGNKEGGGASSTTNLQPATRNTSTTGNQQQATGNSKTTNRTKSAKPASTRNPKPATSNSSTTGNRQQSTNNASTTKKVKSAKPSSIRNQQHVTSNNSNTGNGQPTTDNPVLLTDFNGKAVANTGITSTQAAPANAETVVADKYWMTYINPTPSSDNSMLHNESNTDLPKAKTKIFQYSLGLLVHGGSTIVGAGPYVSDTGNTSLNLGNSFRLGFTHDFMFAKRFALSNSIVYSQSTFSVSNVRSESFSVPPISFTTQIKELAIPIGVKVYPVSKPKIRFYLSAGIVNHIKLSESFTYTAYVVPQDTGNIPTVADVKNTYPTTTNFDGTGNGVIETTDASFTAGTTTTTKVLVNTNEFSINNAKRYYASFYAGAGVEGIIKNKWILFAEPTFSMDLQKIGIQERRKYNVGANLGFRYQF